MIFGLLRKINTAQPVRQGGLWDVYLTRRRRGLAEDFFWRIFLEGVLMGDGFLRKRGGIPSFDAVCHPVNDSLSSASPPRLCVRFLLPTDWSRDYSAGVKLTRRDRELAEDFWGGFFWGGSPYGNGFLRKQGGIPSFDIVCHPVNDSLSSASPLRLCVKFLLPKDWFRDYSTGVKLTQRRRGLAEERLEDL